MHRQVFLQRAARAVEQHVELAEPGDRGFDRTLDAVVLGDVGLDENRVATGRAHVALGLRTGFLIQFNDGDPGALAHEGKRSGFRDAGAGARQKCDFPVQSSHFVSFALLRWRHFGQIRSC